MEVSKSLDLISELADQNLIIDESAMSDASIPPLLQAAQSNLNSDKTSDITEENNLTKEGNLVEIIENRNLSTSNREKRNLNRKNKKSIINNLLFCESAFNSKEDDLNQNNVLNGDNINVMQSSNSVLDNINVDEEDLAPSTSKLTNSDVQIKKKLLLKYQFQDCYIPINCFDPISLIQKKSNYRKVTNFCKIWLLNNLNFLL